MLVGICAALFLALALAACNPAESLRDPTADAVITSTFDKVRRGDPQFAATLTPEVQKDVTSELLARMRGEIPEGEPISRKMLETHFLKNADGTDVRAVDEYRYSDRVLVVESRLSRAAEGQPWLVAGFNVQTATSAEISATRFAAPGKSAAHYLFLAATILSPLLMVAALIKVIRTRGLRRKWMWGIIAFAGLMSFQMNWTTGQVFTQLISLQLIGAGAFKGVGSLAPWVLSMTLPVGAVFILTGVWANPKRVRPKKAPAEAF
jgi:hypothetical protein